MAEKLSQDEIYRRELLKRENKLLSLAERQTDALRKLLQEEKRLSDIFDGKGSWISEGLSNKLAELETLPMIAESISKNLGMEKGTKRILEDKLSEMVHKDKNISDALKHGSSGEVQEKMLGVLLDQLEAMKGMTAAEKAQHEVLIRELRDNADIMDWDKIQEKGNSVFFPLTQKFWEVAEGIRMAATKIPVFGRLASEEMIEHYRQGIEEIGGIFQTHMSTIMAPMDAILGPLKAVGKSMFAIGKTLLSDPSTYEKETAKYTQKTYEVLSGQKEETKKHWKTQVREWFSDKMDRFRAWRSQVKHWLDAKRVLLAIFLQQKKQWLIDKKDAAAQWLEDKKQMIKDKAGQIYQKGKDGLGWIFKQLMKIGPLLISGLTWLGTFITGTLIPALPMIAGFVLLAVTIGKIFMNLFNDAGKFKEMFKAGDWAGMAQLFAADILDGILFIPEMITNWILGLFGSDFRVDFGKDAILRMFEDLNAFIFEWFTEPLFNIIDSIGDFFNKVGEIWTKIKDGLTGAIGTIFSKIGSIFGVGDGEEEGKPLSRKGFSGQSEGVIDIAGELYVPGKPLSERQKDVLRTSKSMGNQLPHGITDKDIAVAKQQQAQIDVVTTTGKKLDAVNNSLTENNSQQQVIIQNIQNSSRKEKPREIPTDTSDLGIMFNNVIYGA